MGQNEMEAMPINSACSTKEEEEEEEDEEGSPIRAIFCLKKNVNMKHFEEMEDCFILDFDPFESVDLRNLSYDATSDVYVVAEKGEVACRDYPHSRHLCLKFPFDKTPHESFCERCYCYVCDSVAPCNFWNEPGLAAHCHAAEHIDYWKSHRTLIKQCAFQK